MATLQLRAGQNLVVYFGSSELAFTSLPTALKNAIVKVLTVNPGGAGFVSGAPPFAFGITSFKPTTDGMLAGYNIITNSAVLVDAALFSPIPAPDPDTFQFTAGPSEPLATTFPSTQTRKFVLSSEVIPAGVGALEYSVNGSAYGSLAAANALIANTSVPFTFTPRLTRSATATVTATVTATY